MTSFRFGWIDYFRKNNPSVRLAQYIFGILFIHSRQVAYYLFSIISFSSDDSILDFGCGDGVFGNWISFKTGARVYGVDATYKRIENAKATAFRYSLHCEYDCSQAESVSFKENSFSKILVIDLLEHINDPEKVLQKCNNWMQPGGHIFISVPQKKQKRWLNNTRVEADYFGYGKDEHKQVGFKREELVNMLTNRGFVEIESREILFTIYQIFWEFLEPLRRKYTNFYRLIVPLIYIFSIIDRVMSIGSGNGIIVIAKKHD